jgi:acyl-CoA synthetase (AMP-forming)/AMP-acid ligase II
MLMAGGLKVYPRDVDEVLLSHSKILDDCAIGISHAYSSERIKAFVVMKPGMKPTADEIIAYCKENLVKYWVSKYAESVDDLPNSANRSNPSEGNQTHGVGQG